MNKVFVDRQLVVHKLQGMLTATHEAQLIAEKAKHRHHLAGRAQALMEVLDYMLKGAELHLGIEHDAPDLTSFEMTTKYVEYIQDRPVERINVGNVEVAAREFVEGKFNKETMYSITLERGDKWVDTFDKFGWHREPTAKQKQRANRFVWQDGDLNKVN